MSGAEHPQLFDAGGPIATSRRRGRPSSGPSHKVNAERPCKEPGCTGYAMYRHQHCEEHARSIDYKLRGGNLAPTVRRTCSCGNEFSLRRRAVSAVAEVWYEFCGDCRRVTPLTLEQLQRHSVPADLARSWLARGSDLPCGVCGRRLSRHGGGSKAAIDHDHGHCKGDRSCGACVRGVLCTAHNTAVAYVELVRADGLLAAIESYLDETPANEGIFIAGKSK